MTAANSANGIELKASRRKTVASVEANRYASQNAAGGPIVTAGKVSHGAHCHKRAIWRSRLVIFPSGWPALMIALDIPKAEIAATPILNLVQRNDTLTWKARPNLLCQNRER